MHHTEQQRATGNDLTLSLLLSFPLPCPETKSEKENKTHTHEKNKQNKQKKKGIGINIIHSLEKWVGFVLLLQNELNLEPFKVRVQHDSSILAVVAG